MPTVQQLFRTISWRDVARCLAALYPEQECNLQQYKKVFARVRFCEPVFNADGIVVCIELVKDENEQWYNVYGYIPGKTVRYGLELSLFEEWAGYWIDEKLLQQMPAPEIAAHILWEMTFYGYSNEDILAQKREIEELLQESYEHLELCIPLEEVLESFEEK